VLRALEAHARDELGLDGERLAATVAVTLIALALLGDVGACLGGAPRRTATIRVVVWGAVAMAVTAAIGALVGTVA
jgi:VIT1/CCC1 family predicted Fe2+/Mn2+ transporter